VLIFDEVMTGFRVSRGGVQGRDGILPDLTTLGKVIGGGLPVGAFGGRAEIMSSLSPEGPVYQAGTLSGNPLAMAAGIATLRALREDAVYERFERIGSRLIDGLTRVFTSHNVPHTMARAGSMFGFFFTTGPVTNLTSAKSADVALFGKFFHGMLDRGVYLAPSQFEAGFLSTAHSEAQVDQTLAAADTTLAELFAGARAS
jgi:glutamate-1-semialdehyde 2,1-aminomutase